MTSITLRSRDEKLVKVDVEIAKRIATIRDLLYCPKSEDLEQQIISIPNVDGYVLRKIVAWVNFHKDDAPLTDEDKIIEHLNTKGLCEWDKQFLNVDKVSFFEIIAACEYLQINLLRNTCAKYIAEKITGKSLEEIRQQYGLDDADALRIRGK
ncbi:S-phase kinase-associated protein 1 [Nasonia vitripennis]|uniref:Skp1-related protein n=1 Tax=Nasonia vitripennis TaxID=7425 RepID=A0A7M7GC95_NASVI|nr:S-phase kinase-associated protein 1 [Nasonia vitripennis]